jgi:hypothetical protein
MKNQLISARVELNDYANRVLGVIKIKFGLKDKSQALNKFIELYGDEVIEREASDEYIKKVISISENHFKKYRNKKMSEKELNNLFEV